MTGILKGAPKYSCSVCGKLFRRRKQHFNHVMRGHNKNTNQESQVQELSSRTMEPCRYYGRAYEYNAIPTGNRHLRTGIPLPRFNIGMRTAI